MNRLAITLIVALLVVASLGAARAEANGVSAIDITCLELDGAYVLSQESPSKYLGFFGSQFASDSIMNSFGTYGSDFSSLSVRNDFGQYGSSFGPYSANNQFASTPPGIFTNDTLIAYLTTNTTIIGGISLAMIDGASCTFFSTSPDIDTSPPAAPTSVSASDGLYSDAIEVTWDSVPGAANYNVFRAEAVEDTPENIGTTADTVLPVFEGEPGKVYWFWVTASNSAGQGNPSEPDSGYIAAEVATFSLTVQKSGDGTGTISSTPSGIDCGSTCEFEFSEGTTVTLTVTSGIGSTFAGWSGACTGTASCVVTAMDSDTAVTAVFNQEDEQPGDNSASIYIPMVSR